MSDIDKDIEIIKKMKRTSLTGGFDTQTERLKAIFTVTAYLENVLSELNKYQEAYKILVNLNSNLKSDLETYKKIEEKIKQKAHYCLEIPAEHCHKYTTAECGKCIIDWAKKEVEND